jgi:hypothetical protein
MQQTISKEDMQPRSKYHTEGARMFAGLFHEEKEDENTQNSTVNCLFQAVSKSTYISDKLSSTVDLLPGGQDRRL